MRWSHFIHGRIHTTFKSYMTHHYTSIASRRSSASWVAVLIQKIWSLYHLPQWENRNKYVHNLDRVTESTRERINLQTSLIHTYTSENINNLLAADKHLLEKPLAHLKSLPNALIRAWLVEHKTAVKERDKIFSAENARSSAILHSFLTQPSPPSQSLPPHVTNSTSIITINPSSLPMPKFNTTSQHIHQQHHNQRQSQRTSRPKRKFLPPPTPTTKYKNQRVHQNIKTLLTPYIPPPPYNNHERNNSARQKIQIIISTTQSHAQ